MTTTLTEKTTPTTGTAPTAVPQADLDAFSGRMLAVLNGGSLALMISIGHRTGLFDALARVGPTSSQGLAAAAGLNERYVREWLGAMTTGAIVEHDPRAGTFALPAAAAALLARGGPINLAVVQQFIGVLGAAEDAVVESFRRGGGVPYQGFTRFHEVMAEQSAQLVVARLEQAVLPLVPGLAARLEAGIDVLDVGCGFGRALRWLARRFPASRFTGYDLCPEAVAAARAEAAPEGLSNLRYEVRDVTDLGETGARDLVTAFDAIHDQAHPDRVLAGVRRTLRPQGVFLMQEIRAESCLAHNLDHPSGPFMYTVSAMHCMTVSLAQGGQGLGTAWGRQQARAHLDAAGFGQVEVHSPEDDPFNDWYVARP